MFLKHLRGTVGRRFRPGAGGADWKGDGHCRCDLCCLLLAACSLLLAPCCLLLCEGQADSLGNNFAACCVLHAACGVLLAPGCLLLAACSWLLAPRSFPRSQLATKTSCSPATPLSDTLAERDAMGAQLLEQLHRMEAQHLDSAEYPIRAIHTSQNPSIYDRFGAD